MKLFLKLLFVLSVLLAGCHSDIYTKRLAANTLKNKAPVSLVSGYLDLRYTENEGIAFSFFESLGDEIRKPALITMQLVSSLVLLGVLFSLRKRSALTLFPFVLILSGAIGNLSDRIRYGYVVDFIHFHVEDKFSWPIFNLADIWVSVGIGLLLLQMLLNRDPFAKSPGTPAI